MLQSRRRKKNTDPLSQLIESLKQSVTDVSTLPQLEPKTKGPTGRYFNAAFRRKVLRMFCRQSGCSEDRAHHAKRIGPAAEKSLCPLSVRRMAVSEPDISEQPSSPKPRQPEIEHPQTEVRVKGRRGSTESVELVSVRKAIKDMIGHTGRRLGLPGSCGGYKDRGEESHNIILGIGSASPVGREFVVSSCKVKSIPSPTTRRVATDSLSKSKPKQKAAKKAQSQACSPAACEHRYPSKEPDKKVKEVIFLPPIPHGRRESVYSSLGPSPAHHENSGEDDDESELWDCRFSSAVPR